MKQPGESRIFTGEDAVTDRKILEDPELRVLDPLPGEAGRCGKTE